MFTAKYQTVCKACGGTIHIGTMASKKPGIGTVHHTCYLKHGPWPTAPAGLAPKPVYVPPAPVPTYASYTPAAPAPATQKAKGIGILQGANLLGKDMAMVATTVEDACAAYTKLAKGGTVKVFMRPCPEYARHGFVDSRQVKSTIEVAQVWQEAKAVDPKAEAILMPFIPAAHSIVWRPGQLSVGPGHDGATAGRDSVSIFLQPAYPEAWRKLATKAGVRLEAGPNPATEPSQAPFIEAVATADKTILTQIRAGVDNIPTEPDYNPYAGMVVGEVIVIDHAKKEDPGAMVEWETTAKTLTKGSTVVYNPGGNMGDHWSVHAQLNGISVVTTFHPAVGQTLPKLGIDKVPLDPQAILYGYLGGLIGPSLLPKVNRERAVAAAILGTHHGLCNGGDAGVFIGASCAFLLRLAQAALFGEARHCPQDDNHAKGLSRQQIFATVLDNWTLGRAGLAAKVITFHTWGQGSGFGGDAWAAVGRGTIDLDTAMITLVHEPTVENAAKVVAVLTNVVNLAHNNGWFLNKFANSSIFDQAEAYDPQVAIMAAPVWYDSVTVPCDQRMALLALLEAMEPLSIGKHASKVLKIKTVKGKGQAAASLSSHVGSILDVDNTAAPEPKVSAKLGSFVCQTPGQIGLGSHQMVSAQCKPGQGGKYQTQITVNAQGQYVSGVLLTAGGIDIPGFDTLPDVVSLAGSGADYKMLPVVGSQIVVDSVIIAEVI